MKITNKSARVVHVNTTNGPITINPQQTLDLSGDKAGAVREALEGPLKALVDAGELELDGQPAPASAAAPNTSNTPPRGPSTADTLNAASGGPNAPSTPNAPSAGESETTSSKRGGSRG